jgi:hypothetical protein
MSRQMFLIQAALLAALVGLSGCPQDDGSGDGLIRIVILGQDEAVWWTEVTSCSPDDLFPSEIVMGSGQTTGHAELVDDQGNSSPGMGYQIIAPSDTNSFAMRSCGLRGQFTVDPDPTLSPNAIQALLGSVAVDVTHLAVVGDSRNYEVSITLSVSGGSDNVTHSDEVLYCLADEFIYCWWDTPYIDVCRYEDAGCNDRYQAESRRLQVSDIMLEAGRTYTVDLEVSGWISSIDGQPEQGGQIDFDLSEIGDPQVLFGI